MPQIHRALGSQTIDLEFSRTSTTSALNSSPPAASPNSCAHAIPVRCPARRRPRNASAQANFLALPHRHLSPAVSPACAAAGLIRFGYPSIWIPLSSHSAAAQQTIRTLVPSTKVIHRAIVQSHNVTKFHPDRRVASARVKSFRTANGKKIFPNNAGVRQCDRSVTNS